MALQPEKVTGKRVRRAQEVRAPSPPSFSSSTLRFLLQFRLSLIPDNHLSRTAWSLDTELGTPLLPFGENEWACSAYRLRRSLKETHIVNEIYERRPF